MERIRELLEKLTTCSAEELLELQTLIAEHASTITETTPESVAVLNDLADATDQVVAETASRAAVQAQAETDAEAARQRIAALNGGDGEEEAEAPEAEGDEPGPEAEAAEAPDAEPAPVAASGTVRRMARRQGPVDASPEQPDPQPNRAVLTAAAGLRGISSGEEITDRMSLAEAMTETLTRMKPTDKPRGEVLCASATWKLPDDRQLTGDAEHNTRIMDEVLNPQALVASGGICAPVNVDYSVPVWATADRPLRDALPSFQATRGGVNFVTPPDIAALAAATGIWTAATDAAPGAATKPVLQIACGAQVTALVDAIPTRLMFGNMQGRFSPEQVAANTDLGVVAAARIAENNLLNKIAAAATAGVTAPAAVLLGVTRDLLGAIDQAVSAYRWVHRIPDSQTLVAIFPAWLKVMIRADLMREIGHEQSDQWNSLAVTDEQITKLLEVHGVRPVWHLDGQPAQGSGTTYPLQGFATQSGTGPINLFPTKTVWYLFAEGQIQFLDGGRLDLGVIRDSTLDATNDYEMFVEPFEGIAFRGWSGGVEQFVSTLGVVGGSGGTVATSGSLL